MQIGSLVETIGDFERVRKEWGLPYPKKGDILTISAITPHPVEELNRRGIVLLNFEEIPGLIGVCDKQADGTVNFIEILPPMRIESLFEEPIKKHLTLLNN